MRTCNIRGRAALGLLLILLPPVSADALVCGDGVVDAEQLCVGAAVKVLATPSPVRAVLGSDVNADSRADIVAITLDRLYVKLGTGIGFGAADVWQHMAVDFRDVATGDFDADGDLDVAIADFANDRVLVRWHQGGPPPIYSGVAPFAVGDGPVRVLSAELDGDGRDDLVVLNINSQTVTVLRAAGMGFAATNYMVGNTPDIAIGDCDADSWIDMIYINGAGAGAQLQSRRNLFGAFAAPVASALPLFHPVFGFMAPLSIVAGDFNASGVAGVSVSAWFAQLAPATSDGDCTFTPTPYASTGAAARRQRATDIDANGTFDVVAPHGLVPAYSVAWGDGLGSFSGFAAQPLGAAVAPVEDVAFGDFNGDGARDVLIATNTGVLLQRRLP